MSGTSHLSPSGSKSSPRGREERDYGPEAANNPDKLAWLRLDRFMPAVVSAVLTATLVLCAGAQAPRTNLLLVTLDTVRADRLGSYGYAQAATPALDRLARDGVRFVDATSQAPLTGPAHVALLTGMYPSRYGIRDNGGTPLPAEAVTLARTLQMAGYQTAAFIGAFILDRPYGFDQGFAEFDARFERFEAGDKLKAERIAERVTTPALAWLARLRPNQPFFAWVHLYDAHTPYSAPRPFGARFRQRPYDGEIAYVDSEIAKLLAQLETMGALEHTMVVAIADHGESLGEHGEEDHGLFLYDAVLRIPWIMRLPDRQRAGTVVTEQVRAVDLMPTVLDALGVAVPPRLDGESVLDVVRGKARPNPPLSYAETWYPKLHFGWSELRSARVGEWKLVDAPRSELYDLRIDKAERVNVIERQANVAGSLGSDLRQVVDGFATASNPQGALPDPETMERLRSLGYVGFVNATATASRGADPKDMAPRLREYRILMTGATDDVRNGRHAAAAEKLKRALAINARAYDAHVLLGDVHLGQRLYEQAIGEYEAAALLNSASADPLLAAAGGFMAQGKLDKAQATIDRAEALEPRSPEIAMARGRLAEQMGRGAEAMAQFQSAVSGNPSDGRARARLANAAMRQGQLDVAASQFSALLEMGYQPARSHYGLGRVAEAHNDRDGAIREYRRALQLDPGFGIARDALARLEKQ